jgi:peptide/nickel transport system ATP-binding protein
MDKINVSALSVAFQTPSGAYLEAIDKVFFAIKPGETFALLGESGCGKSMTASAILQLMPSNAYCHQQSRVQFEEIELLSLSESEMQAYRGKRIGMIFQEPMTSLNPVLTIGQQLVEVIRKHSSTRESNWQYATQLLEQVELPDPQRQLQAYPHQLSGGQKQRVMIAMAIACKPDLLIADEPTTALDVTIQAQILDLLARLTKQLKMAMLLITHDLGIVKQRADRIAVMYAGQIVEMCAADEFFSHPQHPYSQRLLACLPSIQKRGEALKPISGIVPNLQELPTGCRFAPRCGHAQDKCQSAPPIDLQAIHPVRCHFSKLTLNDSSSVEKNIHKKPNKAAKVILEVERLKIHFPIRKGLLKRQVGVVKAVDDVSFKLHQGETLALVGGSGCGKTTLSRAICQLIPISSGLIKLDDKPLDKSAYDLATRLQIVFQDPYSSMNPRMLVEDILLEGIYARAKNSGEGIDWQLTSKLLDMVGLDQKSAQRYPHEFSGGQRQRISIARALSMAPEILICDEPTSALDVSIQAQILNLLLSLQQELNLSYLFISHDLSVVSYMADRIMVMQEGKIVELGNAEQVLRQPQHEYTKVLLSA